MARQPRYKENDRIRHTATGKTGRVVLCINQNDKTDLDEQGPRYYIALGKELWSAPERSLKPIIDRAKDQ